MLGFLIYHGGHRYGEKIVAVMFAVFMITCIMPIDTYNIKAEELKENNTPIGSQVAVQKQILDEDGLMPSSGDVKALTFLVEFSDCQGAEKREKDSLESDLFGENSTSMASFYKTASYGELRISNGGIWCREPNYN